MQRPVCALAMLVFGLSASSCATHTGGNSYAKDYDALVARCQADGGILAPVGQQTGRPETDNVCKITGGATRIPRAPQ